MTNSSAVKGNRAGSTLTHAQAAAVDEQEVNPPRADERKVPRRRGGVADIFERIRPHTGHPASLTPESQNETMGSEWGGDHPETDLERDPPEKPVTPPIIPTGDFNSNGEKHTAPAKPRKDREAVTPEDVFKKASELGPDSLKKVFDTADRLGFLERFMEVDIPKWKSVTRTYTAYDHFQAHYREWASERYFDYDALYQKDSGLAGALSTHVSRHKHDLPEDLKFMIRRRAVGLTEAEAHGITTAKQARERFRDDPRTAHRIAVALDRRS